MLEVTAVTSPSDGNGLLCGGAIDRPRPGRKGVYTLEIEGWALGRERPVVPVEASFGGGELFELQYGSPRPDLADAFPDTPGAATSGFRAALGPFELPREFDLGLRAVLSDGGCATVGSVHGRRDPVRSAVHARLRPIAITCWGRSGGNWVTYLLGQHPELIVYRPFQYDLRVATYWVEILRTVARPASYLRSFAPATTASDWWLGADGGSVPFAAEPELERWLHCEHVEAVAAFCRRRIDAFYTELAHQSGRSSARAFVERFQPDHQTALTLLELDPDGREIVLVRDFRDVLCSVLAFNAKRSFAAFGRDEVESDLAYINYLAERARRLLAARKNASHEVELLRYEDLVRDSEATVGRLLRFLEVDSSGTTTRAIVEAAAQETPEMALHRTTPSAEASIGRWRRELDPAMRELCEQELGPVMTEFGYEVGS